MEYTLMALGDTPAGEGIGGAVIAMLAIIGTFALIYALLEIMDRVRKKKENGKDSDQAAEATKKEFIDVLAEKMREKEDEDRSGKA